MAPSSSLKPFPLAATVWSHAKGACTVSSTRAGFASAPVGLGFGFAAQQELIKAHHRLDDAEYRLHRLFA